MIPNAGATGAFLNVTAATVLATHAAFVQSISVSVSGVAGAIYDATATASTAGRQVAVIPATVGNFAINWPCFSGVIVSPGAGQTLAITLA